jgi:hypothetical protein
MPLFRLNCNPRAYFSKVFNDLKSVAQSNPLFQLKQRNLEMDFINNLALKNQNG